MGDQRNQEAAVEQFVADSANRSRWDVTLGRSGVLLGCALLHDQLPGEADARQPLRDLAAEVSGEIWEYLDAQPPIPDSEIDHLGVAHGWAGFLYATLQWSRAGGAPVAEPVMARLEELRALAYPAGRGQRWSWMQSGRHGRFMPGWCNGSAGHVFLWTLAARLLGRQDYLDLAVDVGWDTWETPFRPASLCCGLAGRAYALLNLFKHTGGELWLARARDLAARAVRVGYFDLEDHPHSLYRGKLALAVLAADLERPEESALPFFEEEGWDRAHDPVNGIMASAF